MTTMITEIYEERNPRLAKMLGEMAPRPLFPFQERVLREAGLESGKSVLVSSPTGTGKSAIGDTAILARLNRGQVVMLCVTTRALARERGSELTALLESHGVRVAVSTRDDRQSDEDILSGRCDLIVTVYEKARFLFQRSSGLGEAVRLIVGDEFQVLVDRDRGPAIRTMLQLWKGQDEDRQLVGLTSGFEEMNMLAKEFSLTVFESEEGTESLGIGTIELNSGVARWECHQTGDSGEFQLGEAWESEESLDLYLSRALDKFNQPVIVFVPSGKGAR